LADGRLGRTSIGLLLGVAGRGSDPVDLDGVADVGSVPASNAATVQARICSNSTPPENLIHEPSEISDTSRSELPSLP
jgi:hypothetical protein